MNNEAAPAEADAHSNETPVDQPHGEVGLVEVAADASEPASDTAHTAGEPEVVGAEGEPASVVAEGEPASIVDAGEVDFVVDAGEPDVVVVDAAPEPAPEIETEIDSDADKNGFEDLGLSPEVVRAVGEKGYRQPTPIQAQAIPSILMGRDVLGTAQTGTGKTGSFVLPMLDILSGARSRARMPRSLILEPTRELALQVAENFVQYGKYLKLTHALLIGGESMSDQKEALMRGVDVLIATPGRLMDLFERGGLMLNDTSLLVIDEADRMLDMGFIPDVEKIVGFLPERRQTLFFSATMAPEIRRLADAFLREPKEISVSRPSSVATTIVAGLAIVDDLDKREALRRLIKTDDVQNALIFCNRKRDVDILYKSLKRHGFSVGSLHGDMSQPERFATLAKFKANELRLLVCSDVAARGIDIGGLSHVFNFDVPIHAEDYVHRIGRTGRAGMTGHAYSLATPYDRGFVEAIEKLVGAPIPRIGIEGFDPVEFAEDDGKKRRGRARATAKPVKPKAKAETLEDATALAIPVPKRRSRGKKASTIETTPAEQPQAEIVEARAEPEAREPTRERQRGRDTASRDNSSRETQSRDNQSRDNQSRDTQSRDNQSRDMRDRQPRDRDVRRERYRRDDDLGPSVVGFGDDVPAFMLLRVRTSKVQSTADSE